MSIKSQFETKEDLERRFFPAHYRAKKIKQAAEVARAEELARLEVRDEHEKARKLEMIHPVGGKTSPSVDQHAKVKAKKSGKPRGRPPSSTMRLLESVLRKIERRLPDGGTLPEVCERLRDAGQKFQVAATPKRAAYAIEYPIAIQIPKYYDVIRKRIRRILGSKLLPRPARTGQNKSRPDMWD